MDNNLTDTIIANRFFREVAKRIAIVDKDDVIVKGVVSYNNKTKEAEVAKFNEAGEVMRDDEGKIITEKKILSESRIMFKNE